MSSAIVMRTRSMRKFCVPSNESRPRCGAELECSQTELYHTALPHQAVLSATGAASFSRVLGGCALWAFGPTR